MPKQKEKSLHTREKIRIRKEITADEITDIAKTVKEHKGELVIIEAEGANEGFYVVIIGLIHKKPKSITQTKKSALLNSLTKQYPLPLEKAYQLERGEFTSSDESVFLHNPVTSEQQYGSWTSTDVGLSRMKDAETRKELRKGSEGTRVEVIIGTEACKKFLEKRDKEWKSKALTLAKFLCR